MLYCKLQTILAHYYYSVTVGFEYSEQNFSLSIIQKRQRNKTFGNSNNDIKKEKKTKQNKTNFMAPFQGWGLTISRLQIHNEDTVYFFLPLGHQELFLVLILCTSERWKAALILNKLPGFELGTPELGIQRLNH